MSDRLADHKQLNDIKTKIITKSLWNIFNDYIDLINPLIFYRCVLALLTKAKAMESMVTLNTTKDEMLALKLCLVLLKDRTIALENQISHIAFTALIKAEDKLSLDLKDEFDGLLKLRHHMDCKLKKICYDQDEKAAREKLFHKINDLGNLQQKCSGQWFIINFKFFDNFFIFIYHLSGLLRSIFQFKSTICSVSFLTTLDDSFSAFLNI